MPRTGLAKRVLGQLVNAASHNAAASEGAATQLFNASMRALSTATTTRAAATGVKSVLQPCTCGKVLCAGHAQSGVPMVFSRMLHAHPNPPKDANEALEYLREGNKRFVTNKLADNHPTRNLERVKATAGGQKPFAAVLSCADSRVPIEIIFDQGFGDVFVTRVAGNIVTNEITGSLEFGTAVLGSQVLMVLGHSGCGAVAATCAGGAVPGVISSLYYSISPALKTAKQGDLDSAIAENVKYQIEQLKVSPVLSGLVKEGKLKIVGGVYDLATGKVVEVA